MYKTLFTLGLAIALTSVSTASSALVARDRMLLVPDISAKSLRYILTQCQLAWPQYNYGQLRSAYNHGDLTIVATLKPDGVYNDVSFGGITLCIIESI
jgi:hypothetical protein